jgi:integrase/recombinase XerD
MRLDDLDRQHDDARRPRVLQVRPYRRTDPRRPRGLRPTAQDLRRREPHPGLDRLELIRFLQTAQTISVHHGALAYLLGINALRASEAAAVRIEDDRETLRGHRVLHLIGKGNNPATMPLTVPVLRVLDACRGERTEGPLILRPMSGKPIDRRDVYRMVARIAKAAGIPRHISPHSLRHAAITNALDAGVPLRDAQILARHADPRTTEQYDRGRGNLDRHGVHFLTAYVAGV